MGDPVNQLTPLEVVHELYASFMLALTLVYDFTDFVPHLRCHVAGLAHRRFALGARPHRIQVSWQANMLGRVRRGDGRWALFTPDTVPFALCSGDAWNLIGRLVIERQLRPLKSLLSPPARVVVLACDLAPHVQWEIRAI